MPGQFCLTKMGSDTGHFQPKNVGPKCPDILVPGPKFVSAHFRPGSKMSRDGHLLTNMQTVGLCI